MPRHRRLRLPRDVEGGLPLAAGERPLAWATDSSGEWYVGTDRALYLPLDKGHRRLPWEQIERADWQQETDVLAVVEVVEIGDFGAAETRTEIPVAEPGRLLELLQERVTKSVVSTSYTPLEGRRGLTVVARRSPTGRGPITWSYVLSRGLDPNDPQVVELLEQARAAAERELGDLA
jgi:hypothetical protein